MFSSRSSRNGFLMVQALAAVFLWTTTVRAAGAATGPTAAQIKAEERNTDYGKFLFFIIGSFAVLPLITRLTMLVYAQIRLLVCLNDDKQRYFAKPAGTRIPWLKKHILYAPLFRVRHNREFQLSSAINVGTLPTRFQAFFLFAYVLSNVIFCTYMIDYSKGKTMLEEIRNRSGVLATVNMIPLFIMAGRNNPLIRLLGISFDSFNLLHRWLGRIVAIESIVHTVAYVIGKVQTPANSPKGGGWGAVAKGFSGKGSVFIFAGFIATCGMIFLMVHSFGALRHAFYESFLILHIFGVITVICGLWFHLGSKKDDPELLHWLKYVVGAVILWSIERGIRFARLMYYNVSRKMTTCTVEALPGDAARVTIRMARPWTFQPGQHLYLYMPKLGLWTSHPFTIAWSDKEYHMKPLSIDDKLPSARQDMTQTSKTMSLIIRRRTGFTDTLYKRALKAPEGVFNTTAFVEGPYGKVDSLASYGTVVLVAGGVGITHPVPYVKELVDGYAKGTVATRRVTLVWVIQSPEHLEWIRPWMTEILAMEKRRDILRILLFVTRPKSTKEIHSPSSTVQMFPGRPNFDTLLNMELENKMGHMAVQVCGSGSLSDEVRRAIRARQHDSNIDFFEEAFSW